ESSDFRSAPSFFAVAASRPVDQIVDERTAAIYELGTEFIQLSPSGQIEPEKQARFAAGLVDLRQRLGLYKEDMTGVTISEQVLYQARIALPSNVLTGQYTAETFAISRGQVIASAIAEVEVRKVGFERFVEVFSQLYALWYGLAAVFLSVSMGWMAGRLFSYI
ncbi:MAG: TIGR02186 family protein, partial [Erythrobacter sp.]